MYSATHHFYLTYSFCSKSQYIYIRSYVMRFLAVQPQAVTPLSIINVIVILLLLYAAYVLDYLLFQFYDPFTKKRQTISFVVYKTSFGITCLPLVIGNENTQI